MRVILCSCPPDAAEPLARTLVEAGAACVNIVAGVTSVYPWNGVLQNDAETLLIIKAAAEKVDALYASMRTQHPYELPEWVVLETDAALTSPAYRQWVRSGL